MKVERVMAASAVAALLLLQQVEESSTQEPSFELPVQLVGFPIIILAVRLSNFIKKLSYSLSPSTYRRRTRRQLPEDEDSLGGAPEVERAERRLLSAFGARACVYGRACAHHAQRTRARARHAVRADIDWNTVLSQYKRSPDQKKEFYLLSVFLGQIVGSPRLCLQLAKRRPCEPHDWTD